MEQLANKAAWCIWLERVTFWRQKVTWWWGNLAQKGCLSHFLKAGIAEMVEGWHELYSKYLKKRMRVIWTLPLRFFVLGHDEGEEDRSDRIDIYHGTLKGGEIGWLLKLKNLECDGSYVSWNLFCDEQNVRHSYRSLAYWLHTEASYMNMNWLHTEYIIHQYELASYRSQCRSEKSGVIGLKRDCWVTFSNQVWNRCAIKKKVATVKSWSNNIATAVVLQASVVREDRMWRMARMWKYGARSMFQILACRKTF